MWAMKAWWKGYSIYVTQPQILSDSNIYRALNVIVQRRQSVQTNLQWDSLSLDSVTILEGAHYSDSPFWTSWFPSKGQKTFLQNDPLINCALEWPHHRISIISTQTYWLILREWTGLLLEFAEKLFFDITGNDKEPIEMDSLSPSFSWREHDSKYASKISAE